MVYVCDDEYTIEDCAPIFKNYPFELSPFQKHAIRAIEQGKHILITAHTGSGKTLPATYAIQKFCKRGKKVIYTSPIKSLSNQKFNEFSKKFPEISFGILTGDIKFNPEADCLIMTTEILRNNLFQQKTIEQQKKENLPLQFQMDTQNELDCVIFDEIHYINDKERGKIWEETIMMLPKHVLIVMLSATINGAEKFAQWIENVKQRDVWLASTTNRVVPLTHYSYITLRDKLAEKYGKTNSVIDNQLNKLIPLRKKHENFQDPNYHLLSKIKTFFNTNRVFVNNTFVLNNITKYLHEHNLLPAICFVFSRRKAEQFAKTISLSFNDSKTMNIIRKECKQILINKLTNWKEYIELPEFEELTQLLQKGIGVHHSGIIPVFKEIIEILFEKGYVKLLFATETFAVGVNMPTKTVIFSGLKKFDGQHFRFLLPHEYTQMSGRAGRRGIDKKGVVIHLNNMFDLPPIQDYRNMLCGKSQTITSKFQINFNLILNLIANKTSYLEFINKSLMNISIQNQRHFIEDKITKLDQHLIKQNELLQFCKTPISDLKTFANLSNELRYSDRKRRKKILKNIQIYKNNHKNIEKEVSKIFDIDNTNEDKYELENELKNVNNYIIDTINTVLGILIDYSFIETPEGIPPTDSYILTTKGETAANIQEVNCLVFGDLIHYDRLKHFESHELATFFSCFSNISIPREDRRIDPFLLKIPTKVKQMIAVTETYYNELKDIELKYQLEFSEEELHYELCEEIAEWCSANSEQQCKIIFQKLKKRKISIGVFIKAILKINNIAAEFEKLFQYNLPMLGKLREIPRMTLKFVVTNQSLYI